MNGRVAYAAKQIAPVVVLMLATTSEMPNSVDFVAHVARPG